VELKRLLWLIILSCPATAFAVDIDGVIGVEEWREAQHITDFRKTRPLTGEVGTYLTEAWVLATPDGLAVAFHNVQPPSVARSNERVQRDFESQVDRNNLIVDFDGDGRTAYNFRISSTDGINDCILTGEQNFNKDWDGNWRHAVKSDAQGWSVEVLIPWAIAPMREAKGGTRTVKLYLDRIIAATGERVAWPQASLDRARFLSDFASMDLANYSQSLLAITPYVSGLYDNARDRSKGDAGVDVFWKPNGQMQLTATVNPDFGQVESDDLVVNFSATETFVSDKRPFFTENQGLFEFDTPSDFSQLLYTRRISGDITAALKLNGSLGDYKYGVFAADEADTDGRTFGALRLVRDFANQNIGVMATQVRQPFLDRTATVVGIDHDWRPGPRWNVHTRLLGSNIDDQGRDVRGDGATVWADYEMDRGWRQQWIAMHFANDLQINDAGYLSRNSTNYLHWQVSRRFSDLPEKSRYATKDWRWRVTMDRNDRGEQMSNQFRMSRESQLRNGGYEYTQINVNSAGVEDLLTRGNGVFDVPASFNTYYDYERPRKGNWSYEVELHTNTGGLIGNDKMGFSAYVEPVYYLSDAFNFYVGLYTDHTPGWLIWQRDNLIGAFDGHESHLSAGFVWTIGNRQELRLKLQAIAVRGEFEQSYRVATGRALESNDPVDDFSVKTLGFQIRYRYELAPLSYLYVVYGRGGFEQTDDAQSSGRLLGDAFNLRDDDQLLVKLSYRFE
jgi:hypothetical protein